MPLEEVGPPSSLHDRAILLEREIDGAKEELAEYDRLSSIVGEGIAAMNAYTKLARTIRGMQGPTVSDLLTRIHSLETLTAANPGLAGALGAAEKERDSLRQLASDQQQTIARLLEQVQEHEQEERHRRHLRPTLDWPVVPVEPFHSHVAVVGKDYHDMAMQGQKAQADELLGHYRAVLHDLSAPAPKHPAIAKAEQAHELAAAVNKLQHGGGAPLGA